MTATAAPGTTGFPRPMRARPALDAGSSTSPAVPGEPPPAERHARGNSPLVAHAPTAPPAAPPAAAPVATPAPAAPAPIAIPQPPSRDFTVWEALWAVPVAALILVAFVTLRLIPTPLFVVLTLTTSIAVVKVCFGHARTEMERYMLRFNMIIVLYLLVGFLRGSAAAAAAAQAAGTGAAG